MTIKVILADDHQVLRQSLAEVLEKDPGIQVIGQAQNGFEAVRFCRQSQPDLIIMDIHMPELNGIEAARQLQLDLPDIKVIMLSMYASKEHIYQAFQAGASGYLLKETSVNEVIEAIKAVAMGKRYLSQALTDTVIDEYFLQRGGEQGQQPLDQLSSRERQILQLVVEGKSSKQIAGLLHLSTSTVATYRSRMMKKLAVKDLAELIKFAIDQGLIEKTK